MQSAKYPNNIALKVYSVAVYMANCSFLEIQKMHIKCCYHKWTYKKPFIHCIMLHTGVHDSQPIDSASALDI